MNRTRYQAHKPVRKGRSRLFLVMVLVAVVAISGVGYAALRPSKTPTAVVKTVAKSSSAKDTPTPVTSVTPAPQPTGACATNTLSQNVIVSIGKRHLWGCTGTTEDYDSPVVTGMENLAADLTPTGTYHIYGKQTDLHLKGSDSTGSWDDPVSYWMPFLSNKYGIYGFHDATWRPDSDFGNIDPYSDKGSHGCVELPLTTAKWLYNWASIGTTVTIES